MFKSKIKKVKGSKPNTLNILQSQDSIIVEVRGTNKLSFESVSNYFQSTKENADYFVDLLFSYNNQLLYTVTDENFWCPTCERIIRKHYTSSSNGEIKEMIDRYRDTMCNKESSLADLINANDPIIKLLPSGQYLLSLRTIFPTFGEKTIFSDFTDNVVTASTDSYYRYLNSLDKTISVIASTSYMLPTQPADAYLEETLTQYREKETLGRGLVIQLSGFLGCLLDGHHKAKIAYERGQGLECLVIEPYVNNVVYKGIDAKNTGLKFHGIPTIEDYCYLQNFIETNDISSIEDLLALIKEVKTNQDRSFYEEMDQLIVCLKTFLPDELIEFYSIILGNYLYKNLRVKYFQYLATLEKTEVIEQLMLDFLINDDYENKQLTQLCENYFR